ncbi:hypothetical protein ED733_005244 [Metarhizium rileyi]|uniref:Uncharacterized protein n=1 Tax=Metarhizium rileyi (strain RCEF 4871) TaxID=1649241 RepID=A0A5C6GG35_METRR|nr:hypothetical protein ED733_005244 [Metarhizium rileyi]
MDSTGPQDLAIATAVPHCNDGHQTDDLSPTSLAPSSEPKKSNIEQRSTPTATDQKHTRSHDSSPMLNRRESCQSSSSSTRQSFSRPKSIFHPRSYEEIYAEQAYLSLSLQTHATLHSALINKYSLTEAESVYGESRKSKRRARKELGVLRGQLVHAAGQEQAIFSRLGELFVEAKSRETWNMAQKLRLQRFQSPRRHSQPQNVQETRARSMSTLNGASPAFVPRKDPSNHDEYDENAVSSADTSENEGQDRDDMSGDSWCEPTLEPTLAEPDDKGCKGRRSLRRSMSGGEDTPTAHKDRRLSLPADLGI